MDKAPEKASVQKALLDDSSSAFRKYTSLFVGKRGFFSFLKYEFITASFGWIPGAAGIVLRRIFYRLLFKKVGRGVAFGRSLTIRHPHKIEIDDNSFIDDMAVLDAKGEANEGIRIGKSVIIGRNTTLSCKEGSIYLDDFVNLSANCSLLSETEIRIGRYSFMAGHCYLVAGGNHTFARTDVPIMFQPSIIKGGIHIGEDCWIASSVTIVDGVKLGKGCVVGAGSVVARSFRDYTVLLGNPASKIKSRVTTT
jgi:acetyltransferase-like isoleucine patch superfamily enzyme